MNRFEKSGKDATDLVRGQIRRCVAGRVVEIRRAFRSPGRLSGFATTGVENRVGTSGSDSATIGRANVRRKVAFVIMRPPNPVMASLESATLSANRIRLDDTPRCGATEGNVAVSMCPARGAFGPSIVVRPQWSLLHTCRRTSTTWKVRPIQ